MKFNFVMMVMIMGSLSSCYCGFFNQNAQVSTFCSPVENTQFDIEEVYSFKERVTPNIQVDTLPDSLKIEYFIGNYGANVELTFYQINETLLLDTTLSSVNVRTSDNFYDEYIFVHERTEIEMHSFTPNTCCENPEFNCYDDDYLKMPGSFIISLDGLIQLDNLQRDFQMEIDMQMLEWVSEEC